MSAMPTFSHHHHHHTPPTPTIGPLSISPTGASSSVSLSNQSSQQCLMQSNSQSLGQSQQLQRDLISPSPYQCHMSVRSGPLTPTPSSVSASSLAAAAAAAYDSLGLVVSSASGTNYNSARHSPLSPSQSANSGLYPLNSNSSVPFGLTNSSNTTGK